MKDPRRQKEIVNQPPLKSLPTKVDEGFFMSSRARGDFKYCLFCNKKFERPIKNKYIPPCMWMLRKFCSQKCSQLAQRGIKRPLFSLKIRGKNHPFWKGGHTKSCGYVKVYSFNHPYKNKHHQVYEHRLVMEKKLGRYLNPDESIHHINGNPTDNRINNLLLFKTNKEHLKFHREKSKSLKKCRECNDVFWGQKRKIYCSNKCSLRYQRRKKKDAQNVNTR
jgi:ribosomal protein L31